MKMCEQFRRHGWDWGEHWLEVAFSLTLTLSRWERGQLAGHFLKFVSRGAEGWFQDSWCLHLPQK
jgi:hypothetical protein